MCLYKFDRLFARVPDPIAQLHVMQYSYGGHIDFLTAFACIKVLAYNTGVYGITYTYDQATLHIIYLLQ